MQHFPLSCGSAHTDCIIAEDCKVSDAFLRQVDRYFSYFPCLFSSERSIGIKLFYIIKWFDIFIISVVLGHGFFVGESSWDKALLLLLLFMSPFC